MTKPTWPLPRLWEPAFRWLVGRRWGRILWLTWAQVQRDEVPLVATSIAYYALFSLFPLLLFLVIAATSYLGAERALVTQLVSRFFPGTEALDPVQRVLTDTLEKRGTTGLVALVALLWSGSGVFTAIARGVNRAWDVSQPRPFWKARLLGVLLALGLALLLAASLVTTTILNVLRNVPQLGWLPGWGILLWVAAIAINFLMFLVLYAVLPNAPIEVRWVLPGAALAALAWEAAKGGFAFYLQNFSRYDLVYGSVGAIIVFLLWAYVSAFILLVGAELCQAYARVVHDYQPPRSPGGDQRADA